MSENSGVVQRRKWFQVQLIATAFAGPASFTYGNGAAYVQDLDYRPSVEQSGPWAKGASYDQASNLSSLLDVDNTEQTF